MERNKYGAPISSSGAGDFKKRQEDAKKKQNGELPPDVDEKGNMINPHNPDFITKVPWYLGESGPTLKHHQVREVDQELSMADADQLIQEKAAKQAALRRQSGKGKLAFRKGSCRNCGAISHKTQDCVERPRPKKKTAFATNTTLASDEAMLRLETRGKVNYAAKRDAWQGYDAAQYKEVHEKFKVIEAARVARVENEVRQAELSGKQAPRAADVKYDSDFSSDSDDEGEAHATGGGERSKSIIDADVAVRGDEAAFQSRTARQGGVGGAQMKTTVSALRIREDVPKYLRNLDLNSAFYDPKTRSMRANPTPNANPEEVAFAGDNFVRHTGDALKLAQAQVVCWDMQSGKTATDGQWAAALDPISNPSAAELVHRSVDERKVQVTSAKRDILATKYGGDRSSSSSSSSSSSTSGGMSGSGSGSGEGEKVVLGIGSVPLDPRLMLGATEAYREYSKDGRIIKGMGAGGRAVHVERRTKYEEDVFPGNHTSVWGSWFDMTAQKWGYACCHATTHNAYCVGQAGMTTAATPAFTGLPPVTRSSDSSTAPTSRQASTLSGKIHPLAGADGSIPEDLEEYSRKRHRASREDVLDKIKDNVGEDGLLALS